MPNFRFQRFELNDDGSAMKIGTDAILLGSWSRCDSARRILDIGTGCGLIALMLAQRTEEIKTDITGVEIDSSAANQAAENFMASPWSDRLTIVEQKVQDFTLENSEFEFDLVVCNPPFFESIENLQNVQPRSPGSRALARQNSELNQRELLESVYKLLAGGGFFCLVIPYDQHEDFAQSAFELGFRLSRQTNVRPLPGYDFKRALLEFNLHGESAAEIHELTLETKHHHYSKDFEALAGEFYLRFKD